jgi:hypothetical protein
MTRALIVDIETIGEKWEDLDPLTQENLSTWTKKEAKNDTELAFGMDALKDRAEQELSIHLFSRK